MVLSFAYRLTHTHEHTHDTHTSTSRSWHRLSRLLGADVSHGAAAGVQKLLGISASEVGDDDVGKGGGEGADDDDEAAR